MAAIVLDLLCRIKNEDHKYYPQFHFKECKYEEKKAKKRNIKEKLIFPDTNESDDGSTE